MTVINLAPNYPSNASSKGVTAFGIPMQATGDSQKLRNHVLGLPMQSN